MDLGPSVLQYDDEKRGFSLEKDGPLDMRMDYDRDPESPTAFDVINTLESIDLSRIFKQYGEEKYHVKIAQAIIDTRFMMHSIKSTKQLSDLISSVLGDEVRIGTFGSGDGSSYPLSASTVRVFRALRMFVNNEINELNYAIKNLRQFLRIDPKIIKAEKLDDFRKLIKNEELDCGIMSVISFNRVEDTIVKDHFVTGAVDYDSEADPYKQRVYNFLETATDYDLGNMNLNKKWIPLEKFVLFPQEVEVLSNPFSKSAKLRCAVRRL